MQDFEQVTEHDQLWHLLAAFLEEEFEINHSFWLTQRCYNVALQFGYIRERRNTIRHLPLELVDYLKPLALSLLGEEVTHLWVLDGGVTQPKPQEILNDKQYFSKIVQMVCSYYGYSGVSQEYLRLNGGKSSSLFRMPRLISIYLCRQAGYTLAVIGEYFDRTPPAILYAYRKAEKLIEAESEAQNAVVVLRAVLKRLKRMEKEKG